jgi:hypothetical protein
VSGREAQMAAYPNQSHPMWWRMGRGLRLGAVLISPDTVTTGALPVAILHLAVGTWLDGRRRRFAPLVEWPCPLWAAGAIGVTPGPFGGENRGMSRVQDARERPEAVT